MTVEQKKKKNPSPIFFTLIFISAVASRSLWYVYFHHICAPATEICCSLQCQLCLTKNPEVIILTSQPHKMIRLPI